MSQSEKKRIYSSPPGRYKHRWNKDYAGFCEYHKEVVGKCPTNIPLEKAQELLDEAISDPPDPYDADPYPKRLYNVYNGVIYLAIGDGKTKYYHAFPADNIDSMDSETLCELKERAKASGDEKMFKKWVKENGSRRTKI